MDKGKEITSSGYFHDNDLFNELSIQMNRYQMLDDIVIFNCYGSSNQFRSNVSNDSSDNLLKDNESHQSRSSVSNVSSKKLYNDINEEVNEQNTSDFNQKEGHNSTINEEVNEHNPSDLIKKRRS